MNKNDKIKILKALRKGRQLEELLPTINVTLIEVDRGELTDFDAKQLVPIHRTEEYLEQKRREIKGSLLRITVIYHDEFTAISQQLENEY